MFPTEKSKNKGIDIRKPWLDDATLKGKIKERNRLCSQTQKNKWTINCGD